MKKLSYLILAGFIAGCAGSAEHKVVSSHEAGDDDLTCKQIQTEIVKTQVIIDDVNKDKEDISGADIMDGILWFPFNLIAKDGNYKDALEAAGARIKALKELKKEKNCSDSDQSRSSSLKSEGLAAELEKLSNMRKQGVLTDEEYATAKKKLLDRF